MQIVFEDTLDLNVALFEVDDAVVTASEGLVGLYLADCVFFIEDDLISPLERDDTIFADWVER